MNIYDDYKRDAYPNAQLPYEIAPGLTKEITTGTPMMEQPYSGDFIEEKVAPQPVTFEMRLARLINEYSLENGSNTPDFALAQYLYDCLQAFNKAMKLRSEHFGDSDYFTNINGFSK